ncbi:MAG: anion permease [Eubacteriales bacterium]|nr:anion permease [Eubacteriales bacterium]
MKDKKYWINLIIGLAFVFLFRYLPAPEPLTPVGVQIIGLFIGTIYMIATIHPAFPAFLAITILITTPLYNFKTAFASSFGSWVPIFVMSILFLSHALVKSGLVKRITIWFMTREIAKKSPWIFLSLFFGSIFVLGFFIDVFALQAFYFSSVAMICTELGYEKKSKFANAMILGVTFLIVTIGASTGFQPHVAIVLGLYNTITGSTIGLFEYSAWSFIPLLLLFVSFMLIIKFIMRPDLSNFKSFDATKMLGELPPMSKQEKYTGIIYLIVVLGWFLPGFAKMIGWNSEIIKTIGSYSLVWPAFVGMILLSIVRVKGEPLMDITKAAKEGVPWHIVFLIVGNMFLADALTNEATGFTAFFTQTLEPLTQGASPVMLFFFGALFTMILTNIGSNSIAGIIGFQLVALLINDPQVLMLVALPVAFATRIAVMLPSSFVGTGMAYGNEWVDAKKILPYGFLFVVVALSILMVVGWPLANLIFN